MTITSSLLRFGRRQLHTIISTEIVKPSTPTPSQLKTHNLSLLDQCTMNSFMPIISFYPYSSVNQTSHDITLDLKNSLSQTLTKYYPFAGRHAKYAPSYVDCNDEGSAFHEASIDSTLSDFLQNSKHEDFDQFFPYARVNFNSNREYHDLQSDKVIPLAVQVNHFECGGVAVAVSISHKVADGGNLVHFISDWAKMTRFSSQEKKHELPTDPTFLGLQDMNINFPGFSFEISNDCVTRSFMFTKSKINDLKLKVKAMTSESGQPITNTTRVEVLNWLLYKCAVSAATKNNASHFKPTLIGHLANMRGKMMEPLPEMTIGNFWLSMEIYANKESELSPEVFITELQKQKMYVKGISNIETFFTHLSNMSSESELEAMQKRIDTCYICTSLCGSPIYDIDFGWGKPLKTTLGGNLRKNSFVLIDAPNGDGIEALVCLGNEDMTIFQNDPELLAFC